MKQIESSNEAIFESSHIKENIRLDDLIRDFIIVRKRTVDLFKPFRPSGFLVGTRRFVDTTVETNQRVGRWTAFAQWVSKSVARLFLYRRLRNGFFTPQPLETTSNSRWSQFVEAVRFHLALGLRCCSSSGFSFFFRFEGDCERLWNCVSPAYQGWIEVVRVWPGNTGLFQTTSMAPTGRFVPKDELRQGCPIDYVWGFVLYKAASGMGGSHSESCTASKARTEARQWFQLRFLSINPPWRKAPTKGVGTSNWRPTNVHGRLLSLWPKAYLGSPR